MGADDYRGNTDTGYQTGEHTTGRPFDGDAFDADAVRETFRSAAPQLYNAGGKMYDADTPHNERYADDGAWREIDATDVQQFAAASGDDQRIHVDADQAYLEAVDDQYPLDLAADVDGGDQYMNVVHGALLAGGALSTLDAHAEPVKRVNDVTFAAPVRYADEFSDEIRLVAGADSTYALQRRTPDGTIETAMRMDVDHGAKQVRSGGTSPFDADGDEVPLTGETLGVGLAAGIGSYDRDGDILLELADAEAYGQLERTDWTDVVLEERGSAGDASVTTYDRRLRDDAPHNPAYLIQYEEAVLEFAPVNAAPQPAED